MADDAARNARADVVLEVLEELPVLAEFIGNGHFLAVLFHHQFEHVPLTDRDLAHLSVVEIAHDVVIRHFFLLRPV